MLYSEREHAKLMEELEALGEDLTSDPQKLQDFLYDAGVVDKEGNFT